ncbi:MAG: GGDEF domain-containing protein [Pseudomonadales bacterium]|nr:GGDEF domain-containing protein [Gammaproteobacteria bacterium]NNC55161.1 GGDEF domain-containing protein [Pseudomonadales bacterium]NNL56502.1 GGDEF domain-containing protein [Pseudomonadales bacterium]
MAWEFPENKTTASRYVKEAIPMMVKNNIVPNPRNFALWYAYVSKRDAELNTALDDTIAAQGTCPEEVTEELFNRHVMKDEMALQQGLQNSLANVIKELAGDVENTRAGADHLSDDLEQSLDTLVNNSDPEQIKQTVQGLIASAKTASQVVSNFKHQLNIAEQEISTLKSQLEEKEKDLYCDALTELGNRRAFDKKLYALCEAGNQTTTMVLIDIDHFKTINDSYGHVLGDKVLQGIAQILASQCPENALAARYGGEEFAFLIEGDTAAGKQLAEVVRQQIQKLSLRKKNSDELIDNITASFGVAEKLPGEHPEQLIERADAALYAAKNGGRDRIEQAA